MLHTLHFKHVIRVRNSEEYQRDAGYSDKQGQINYVTRVQVSQQLKIQSFYLKQAECKIVNYQNNQGKSLVTGCGLVYKGMVLFLLLCTDLLRCSIILYIDFQVVSRSG